MKIAVNGKSLGIAQPGGAVRVALNLLDALAREAPAAKIDVFMPMNPAAEAELDFPPNVRLLPTRDRDQISGTAKSLWEQWELPRAVRGGHYDILLNLTNSAPVLVGPGCEQLLLMHDSGFLHTEWFSRAYSMYVRTQLRLAMWRGMHLATVSRTSERQLQGAIPGLRSITAIANGVDDPPAEIPASGIDQPFVLFLGSINPRKNLRGALEGFRRYKNEHGGELQLVIVGAQKSIFSDAGLESFAGDDIRFLGYVDDARKWGLLRDARALLLPSFLEGFGLPIAEAMKVGTAAVVSDIEVFRELFEDIPEYVNPQDAADIARGLHAVEQRAADTALAERARAHCARYNWQTAARAYLELCERIIAAKGS